MRYHIYQTSLAGSESDIYPCSAEDEFEAAGIMQEEARQAADHTYETANILADQGEYEGAWRELKLSEQMDVLSLNLDWQRRLDGNAFDARNAPDHAQEKMRESIAKLLHDELVVFSTSGPQTTISAEPCPSAFADQCEICGNLYEEDEV